jgi:hypothetical protein
MLLKVERDELGQVFVFKEDKPLQGFLSVDDALSYAAGWSACYKSIHPSEPLQLFVNLEHY